MSIVYLVLSQSTCLTEHSRRSGLEFVDNYILFVTDLHIDDTYVIAFRIVKT